jgi:CubicO group peptidase (beta-lactamase class C family)
VEALAQLDSWPVTTAAAAVVAADGSVLGRHGDTAHAFLLASVTKLLTAYAVLVAVEEGAVDLDEPAGPPGATVAHLLAHASGLATDEPKAVATPGTRRIYSTAGFEVLADHVAERTRIGFADYLGEAVLAPLGMAASALHGSPGAGGVSTVDDLVRFVAEVQSPTLLAPSTVSAALQVAFPGLAGVLPVFGRQEPNDWGLGFEIRGGKRPHWTGATNSPGTAGHFGRSGTFAWVDPEARLACVCLSDREFGPWAAQVWPGFNDAVLSEATGSPRPR